MFNPFRVGTPGWHTIPWVAPTVIHIQPLSGLGIFASLKGLNVNNHG